MRLSFLAATAFLLALCQAEAINKDQLQLVQILYQPTTRALSDTTDFLLASINYDASTLENEVLNYSPPAATDTTAGPQKSTPLIRIFPNSPHSSTTITSLAAFDRLHEQTLILYLGNDSLVFAASFSADSLPQHFASNSSQPNLKVALRPPTPGPAPKLHLRKPTIVGSDGKEIPQAPLSEKSFFQKYWWAFALLAVLALSGGGDK